MRSAKFIGYFLLIVNTHLFCMPKLEEDKYNVGFRYFKEYDTTRLYIYNQDTIFRPMLVHFWYPSKGESEKDRMNYKQYIDLISLREDFAKTNDIIDKDSYNFLNAYAQFAQRTYEIGVNINTQQILESPVEASLNLPIEQGEFPLIIYAPSNSKSPIQNHIICEYLASQGFYVVSVSSAGPNSIERNELGKSVLAQVEDMEFILNYAENHIKISYSNVGLLGFSTGGLATSIFQMKHTNTQAVFSMDGSHEYVFYLILSQLEAFDLDKTAIPYFLVTNQNRYSIYPYFNSIKSNNKYLLRMPYLDHFGFVSFWTYFDNCNPDTVKHNYSLSYPFICESAFTFFDAALNGNKKSYKKLLSFESNDYAIKENLDYSESTNLLNLFLAENIDSAISIYKHHKEISFNNYDYNEEEISILGRMIIDGHLDASIKLFLFNQEEHPGSWHAYFDLAYAYKLKGEIDLAKKTLFKAQEKEPDNEEVKKLLKDLENQE